MTNSPNTNGASSMPRVPDEEADDVVEDSTSAENIRALRRVLDSPNIAEGLKVWDTHLREKRKTQRELALRSHWFIFAGYLVAVSLVASVLYLFQEKPDVLLPVLTSVVAILATVGAAFGFRPHK